MKKSQVFLFFLTLLIFTITPIVDVMGQAKSTAMAATSSSSYNRTELANKVVAVAKKYLGVPYKLGAEYDRDGSYKFDCSSFTQRVFYEVGIKLPRTVLTQLKATKKVPIRSAKIGDLVYFDTDFSGGTNHVGIYIGNGRVIHASTANGGKVQITNVLASKYWSKTVTYVTRVL